MENDNILEELRSQTFWLRTIALQALQPLLQEELKSEEDRKIYELSDGIKTTRAIAKAVGTSHTKVARKWNQWTSLGLVIQGEKFKGRYKKITSLG
jgi:hypothetical protein